MGTPYILCSLFSDFKVPRRSYEHFRGRLHELEKLVEGLTVKSTRPFNVGEKAIIPIDGTNMTKLSVDEKVNDAIRSENASMLCSIAFVAIEKFET